MSSVLSMVKRSKCHDTIFRVAMHCEDCATLRFPTTQRVCGCVHTAWVVINLQFIDSIMLGLYSSLEIVSSSPFIVSFAAWLDVLDTLAFIQAWPTQCKGIHCNIFVCCYILAWWHSCDQYSLVIAYLWRQGR